MKTDNLNFNNQGGFSLLELLVGILIFTIVMSSVYGLLQIGMIDRNRSSRRADVMKNVRTSIHLIGRDALNAGLSFNKSGAQVPDNFISTRLGTPADNDTSRDILTSVIGGDNIYFNILQPNPSDKTDVISFVYRDLNFNSGNIITVNDVAAAPSSASTARLQTATSGTINSKLSDLYLIESDNTQAAFFSSNIPSTNTIDVATGDALAINQPFDATGETGSLLKKCSGAVVDNCTKYPATLKRFFWVSYRVKSDGTLVRIVYGNNPDGSSQIQELPLAYNVQDLQFRYVLSDGTVTDAPNAGVDNTVGTADDEPTKFNLVRQIIVTVKVQAIENDEQMSTPETITISGTFATRNIEYDAG